MSCVYNLKKYIFTRNILFLSKNIVSFGGLCVNLKKEVKEIYF